MAARVLLSVLSSLAIAGCAEEGAESKARRRLTVGIVPGQDREELAREYEPLVNYLAEELQADLELGVCGSYEEILENFDKGRLQMALFGGLTFVRARERSGAIPIAMRDIDLRFTSAFLVPASSPATSIEDFRGKRFCFGARLSTSGHVMPRYFLERYGIQPETFFGEVIYSGAHDKTALLVRDGEADIGVANATTVQAMFRRGQLDREEVRVLNSTPRYRDYVWAVSPDLDAALRERLLDAFLALDLSNPEHQTILEGVQAGGFVPARKEDFDDLESIARRLGVLPGRREPSS